MQSTNADSLLGGAALCDSHFQQDLVDIGQKLALAKDNCRCGQISLNELLYEVEEFIKTVKEKIWAKRSFAYRDHVDVVLDKYFHVMIEHFPTPQPLVTRACFESLVRGKVSTADFLPKMTCTPPNDMASFFFKTAHVFQQLNKSKHSFISVFSDAQVQTRLDL